MTRQSEGGAALFEAIVALTIIVTAGSSVIALIGEAMRAERALAERERTLIEGDRVLAAATLLTADELAQRIGSRPVGEFVLDISRPEPALYRIALAAERAPELEMLVTLVYRPVPVGSVTAP